MKTPHRRLADELIATLGVDEWEYTAERAREQALSEFLAGVDLNERYGELRRAELEERARERHRDEVRAAHAAGLRLIDEWGDHQAAAGRLSDSEGFVQPEDFEEFQREVGLMLSCATRLRSLAERYVRPETLAILDEQIGIEETRGMVNQFAQAIHENARAEKLRMRYVQRIMSEPTGPETHLCVQCGKKPRHFGDLCKRCANASGQRPVGKV